MVSVSPFFPPRLCPTFLARFVENEDEKKRTEMMVLEMARWFEGSDIMRQTKSYKWSESGDIVLHH